MVAVRRLRSRHPDTGQATRQHFDLRKTYLFSHCDLAYATTSHAAQGKTVGTTHVLVDGLGDRQGLYVAMSRGREDNYAYCVTGFPRMADIREGSRPAPELKRAHRVAMEQAGLDPQPAADEDEAAQDREPVGVLADVLQRDGAALSATETLASELSHADHLGVLGAIWYDLARRAQVARLSKRCRTTSRHAMRVARSVMPPAPGCGGRCGRQRRPGSTAARPCGLPSSPVR